MDAAAATSGTGAGGASRNAGAKPAIFVTRIASAVHNEERARNRIPLRFLALPVFVWRSLFETGWLCG